jgi:hypothetical protein
VPLDIQIMPLDEGYGPLDAGFMELFALLPKLDASGCRQVPFFMDLGKYLPPAIPNCPFLAPQRA